MDSSLVEVARFYTRHEAEWAQTYLSAAGIDSLLRSDDAGGMEVGLSFSNFVRVLVRPEEAEDAREVLSADGSEAEDGDDEPELPRPD